MPIAIGLVAAFACLGLTSCRTVPLLPEAERDKIPVIFEASLPVSFRAEQTLVFEFRPHWWWPTVRMTALGYATVNRRTGDYAVVCLSPLGVKLFDVACRNGIAETRMMFPMTVGREAVEKAIRDDLRTLLLDWVPPRSAAARQSGDRLRFSWGRDAYEYSAGTGRLVGKEIWNGDARSTVAYSNYGGSGGPGYPSRMVLQNHEAGYRLTLWTAKLESIP